MNGQHRLPSLRIAMLWLVSSRLLSTYTVASSFTSGIPLLKHPSWNKKAYEIQNFGIFGIDFRFQIIFHDNQFF